MTRVFVTQVPARLAEGVWTPTVDLQPARDHGEIIILLPSGVGFATPDEPLAALRGKLADFNVKRDFLLPMGDPMLMVIAAALLAPRFRLLRWDRRAHKYYPTIINVA